MAEVLAGEVGPLNALLEIAVALRAGTVTARTAAEKLERLVAGGSVTGERADVQASEIAAKFAAAFVHACDDEGTYFGMEQTYHDAAALLKDVHLSAGRSSPAGALAEGTAHNVRGAAPRLPGSYQALFLFTRDGHPVHVHHDRSVFEGWMRESSWLYPPTQCQIIEYRPATFAPTHKHADGGNYQLLGHGKVKRGSDTWERGVFYRNADGMLFCTDLTRWNARFMPITSDPKA